MFSPVTMEHVASIVLASAMLVVGFIAFNWIERDAKTRDSIAMG